MVGEDKGKNAQGAGGGERTRIFVQEARFFKRLGLDAGKPLCDTCVPVDFGTICPPLDACLVWASPCLRTVSRTAHARSNAAPYLHAAIPAPPCQKPSPHVEETCMTVPAKLPR